MFKNGYRDRADDIEIKDSVMPIIDDIERDVNNIKDYLEPYKILTEINEVYEMLEELSKKLY